MARIRSRVGTVPGRRRSPDGRVRLGRVSCPAGPSTARVLDLIAGLDDVVGAAITEHAPRARNPREEEFVRALGTALLRFA